MSYNHRMSMVPNSQQQNRGKKKEDDSDAFMRLPEKEIAGCISDIGVPFTVADLQKPNPVQIQMIFELFVEVLMNATRETVDPAMRAAAEEICGEYMDVIPADTRNLMGFYMSLRKLLIECGIEDFSFQDLFKPTTDRLVKIFSYIINFVRFRESQTGVIDEHLNKVENTKVRIESLYMENQDMEARLEEMERNKKAMEGVVQEKKRRNEELKQRLLQLKGSQEKVTRRFENAKIKKGEVTAILEDKTAATIILRQESAKLRPYTRQSTPALQASLMELSNALNTEKTQIDTLDRRARGLQTSTDTFSVVTSDVESCIKLIEDISTELETEEKENAKITKQRDHLGDEGNKVRDIERREAYNKRQLARWKEKAAKVKENDEENSKLAKERTKQLKELYQKQNAERTEKGKEMEKRRVKTEQIEKKMADLKENIENEIHSAHDEFMAMDSHIRLYITEMEQSI